LNCAIPIPIYKSVSDGSFFYRRVEPTANKLFVEKKILFVSTTTTVVVVVSRCVCVFGVGAGEPVFYYFSLDASLQSQLLGESLLF
jgi:hypothetical protein